MTDVAMTDVARRELDLDAFFVEFKGNSHDARVQEQDVELALLFEVLLRGRLDRRSRSKIGLEEGDLDRGRAFGNHLCGTSLRSTE